MLADYSHSESLQPDEPRPGRDGGQNEQTKGKGRITPDDWKDWPRLPTEFLYTAGKRYLSNAREPE